MGWHTAGDVLKKERAMDKDKFKKVLDWVWSCSEIRYFPAYWTNPQRLLRKSDFTVEDVEMYEEDYDCWLAENEKEKS